ncbi:MAG TPA: tRNA (adenosine(37)-N6)-dimethylallyltransferase MiaA [Actinomycetota bacterium]|nr:tRNA (adenosine(37)-N6)-dimethylallyltransferase MiaA [Actinomycetota bacterium]
MTQRVVAIVGATAVGKTELSIEAAQRLGAEIVSVDSMQIYRGMDVGTAKPDAAVLGAVPHHLVDVFDPSHDVTVAEFRDLARDAIDDIGERTVPLLVGGSGLYFRAVVDRLSIPPSSVQVRGRLESEVDTLGTESLHARLVELDPDAAAKIEPGNARRIVRALEVIEITGRRFSDNDGWDRYESVYDLVLVGLTRPRDDLYARIEARVDSMLAGGLVEETRRVAAAGMGRTARQALGYRQILDLEEAEPAAIRDAIVRATKRFARRQESWFRSDPRVAWFDISEPGGAEAAIAHLEAGGR